MSKEESRRRWGLTGEWQWGREGLTQSRGQQTSCKEPRDLSLCRSCSLHCNGLTAQESSQQRVWQSTKGVAVPELSLQQAVGSWVWPEGHSLQNPGPCKPRA